MNTSDAKKLALLEAKSPLRKARQYTELELKVHEARGTQEDNLLLSYGGRKEGAPNPVWWIDGRPCRQLFEMIGSLVITLRYLRCTSHCNFGFTSTECTSLSRNWSRFARKSAVH